jgi:glycosyltransferase involved in cell wall biosynthesis
MTIRFLSRGPLEQISGGYLYNKYVIAQLRRAGADVVYHGGPYDVGSIRCDDVVIVDSLVIDDVAARLMSVAASIVLLLHVVPSCGERDGAFAALCRRSRVVVTGTETLRGLHGLVGAAALDVVQIEPGVPRHWHAKRRYSRSARALLGLANYVRGKGIERVLDVLVRLGDLPWSLTFYGNATLDPACFDELQARARAHGLAGRVELRGAVPHHIVNEKMLGADLLVHFSEHESYSMVTAEAVACGLPVFAHRTGNAAAFERSGLVRYFDGDDSAAAAGLRALIADEHAYGALRAAPPAARRTWQDVGRDFAALLGRA